MDMLTRYSSGTKDVYQCVDRPCVSTAECENGEEDTLSVERGHDKEHEPNCNKFLCKKIMEIFVKNAAEELHDANSVDKFLTANHSIYGDLLIDKPSLLRKINRYKAGKIDSEEDYSLFSPTIAGAIANTLRGTIIVGTVSIR